MHLVKLHLAKLHLVLMHLENNVFRNPLQLQKTDFEKKNILKNKAFFNYFQKK
jgi:hypothetical protein